MSLASEVTGKIWTYLNKINNNEVQNHQDEFENARMWQSTIEEITQLFLDEDWELSKRTIKKEVEEAFKLSYPADDKEKLKEYVEELIEDLNTESIFTAYIYFPMLSSIPENTKIGKLTIIEKPSKKQEAIDVINSIIKEDKIREGQCWGKIEFKSYKRKAYLREELFKELSLPLSIIDVSLGMVSTPENLCGAIYTPFDTIYYLKPDREPHGGVNYLEDKAEPTLSKLSDMALKDESDLTPLEKNILGALQLLTLQSHRYRNEHSFLVLIATLEKLLLTRSEPKGRGLAEKIVFLLLDEDSSLKEKKKIYRMVKGWYNTRSNLIHGDIEWVNDKEIRGLSRTIKRLVRKMIFMTDDYHSIQSQGGEDNPYKGLNDFFLEKRIS